MHNRDTYTGASFSLKNRMARVLWNICYVVLFRYSPRPLHSWRSFILRCFGANIGKGAHVYPKVKIWAPWNIVVGSQSGIADGVNLYSQGIITIGNRSVISQGTQLVAGTHDYNDPGFPLVTRPISIGDYCWVAAETFIHPGISLADGCVIGARSVVSKNMPAWTICSGHPCKPIKSRYNFTAAKEKHQEINT